MFTTEFEKQYKETVQKVEVLTEQTKQAYEFWLNCVFSSLKTFYKTK